MNFLDSKSLTNLVSSWIADKNVGFVMVDYSSRRNKKYNPIANHHLYNWSHQILCQQLYPNPRTILDFLIFCSISLVVISFSLAASSRRKQWYKWNSFIVMNVFSRIILNVDIESGHQTVGNHFTGYLPF